MDKGEALSRNTIRTDNLVGLAKSLAHLPHLLIDFWPSGFREIELELIASPTVFGKIPNDGMTLRYSRKLRVWYVC